MTGQTLPVEVTRVVKLNGDGAVKAVCDLEVADQFLVRGLRVVDGKNGVFVSMPRQQNRNGKWFDAVSVLTKEMKEEVGRVVLDAYHQQPAVEPPDSPEVL